MIIYTNIFLKNHLQTLYYLIFLKSYQEKKYLKILNCNIIYKKMMSLFYKDKFEKIIGIFC